MNTRDHLNGHWRSWALGLFVGLSGVVALLLVQRTWAEMDRVEAAGKECCAKAEENRSVIDRRTGDRETLNRIRDEIPQLRSEIQSANGSAKRAQRSADRAHEQAKKAEAVSREALSQTKLNAHGIQYIVDRIAGNESGPPPTVERRDDR